MTSFQSVFDKYSPVAANGNGTNAALMIIGAAINEVAEAYREQSNLSNVLNDCVAGLLAWRAGEAYDSSFDALLTAVGVKLDGGDVS
jgi:hypothetical protein